MSHSLVALTRSGRADVTRASGQIPGTLYGGTLPPASIAVDLQQFTKLYSEAGESTLIDLTVDGKSAGKVLVQDVQHDPLTSRLIHLDLRRIDMNKELTAPVELRFVGEAPVIKASGGTLVTTLNTVTVKCLPKDLVSHIDVNISTLASYDVSIAVKDIVVPAGIAIIEPAPEALVVKAAPAITEEEIKAMEEAGKAPVDLSKIESAVKKKEKEDEAEGAAAATEGDKAEKSDKK